jgi:UDP-glucose 4-epimerase
VRGDFLNRTDVENAVAGQDFVFHFLSTTSPATAQSDPRLDIRTNVESTVELLQSCVRVGIKHFYFASTGGAIYGPQRASVFDEHAPTLPVSPYAIGKLSIENYLRYFEVMHGLTSTTFRISNPYGPRQKPHRRQGLIPIALRSILDGEPVMQFGDGSMVRDYLFVEDLVAMISRVVGKDSEFQTYNLGSGVGYSITEVFDSIRRVTGGDFDRKVLPKPATFIERVVLDTRRFQQEFGLPALANLDEGIARTYAEMVNASE